MYALICTFKYNYILIIQYAHVTINKLLTFLHFSVNQNCCFVYSFEYSAVTLFKLKCYR